MEHLDPPPPVVALCAGYESGRWRATELARHLFEWLPEFALTWSERQTFGDATGVSLLRRAARVIYDTPKYRRRGEFGELLLHALVRQLYGSEPAVSKIFYKDSQNDTVKGFDSVHIVPATDDELQLWLGEVKFYKSLGRAIADVVDELHKHTLNDYLRSEFMLVTNKIDDEWPFAEQLKSLLDENTSLDEVFSSLHVPVLLTYDSHVVDAHDKWCDEYYQDLTQEILEARRRFISHELPSITIHLILVPLQNKDELLSELHDRLLRWQGL